MALVDCPNCGHRASSAASECPECGNPIRQGSGVVEDHIDPDGSSPKTDADTADTVASVLGERRSGLPTWLLFVLVFVGGSVVLVAGVVAVVVVVGTVVDELGDSSTASVTTTIDVATTVPAGGGENGLLVGECIDGDELDNFLAGDDFSVMACGDPHDYEVYFVYEYVAGPYPGDEAVLDELGDMCWGEFENYVGRDYETSALDIYRVWPGQGLWESGNRIGECLLFDFEGDKLTGSAYESDW